MPALTVQIERFVDDHFPGFVECRLVDASGRSHLFIEKAPIVTTANLGPNSPYPCDGTIGCEVESEFSDERGRRLSCVHTGRPWSIESTEGIASFVVLSSQVIHDDVIG